MLMVEVPFPEKITPRSTDLLLTLLDGLQSHWSLLASAAGALFNCHMPLGSQSHSPSLSSIMVQPKMG